MDICNPLSEAAEWFAYFDGSIEPQPLTHQAFPVVEFPRWERFTGRDRESPDQTKARHARHHREQMVLQAKAILGMTVHVLNNLIMQPGKIKHLRQFATYNINTEMRHYLAIGGIAQGSCETFVRSDSDLDVTMKLSWSSDNMTMHTCYVSSSPKLFDKEPAWTSSTSLTQLNLASGLS